MLGWPASPLRNALASNYLFRDGQHLVEHAILSTASLAALQGMRLGAPLVFRDCRFHGDDAATLAGLALPALALECCRFSGAALRLAQCDIERDLRLEDLDGLADLTLTDLRIGGHLILRRPGFAAPSAAERPEGGRILRLHRIQARGDLVCRFAADAPPDHLELDRVQAGTLLLAQAEQPGFGRPVLGFIGISGSAFAGSAEIAELEIAAPWDGRLLVAESQFAGTVSLSDVALGDLARFQNCVFEKPLRLSGAPARATGSADAPRLALDDCTLHSLSIGPKATAAADAAPPQPELALAAVAMRQLRIAGDMTWRSLRIGDDIRQVFDDLMSEDDTAPAMWQRVEVRGQWTCQAVRWDGALRADVLDVAGGITLDGCGWTGPLELKRLQVQGAGLRITSNTAPGSPIRLPGAQLSALETPARFTEGQLVIHAEGARIARLDLSDPPLELRLDGARVTELLGIDPAGHPHERAAQIADYLMPGRRHDPVLGDSIVAALVARGDLDIATEFAIERRRLALEVPPPPDPRRNTQVDLDRLGRWFLFRSSRFGFDPWQAIVCLFGLWLGAGVMFDLVGGQHLSKGSVATDQVFNGFVYAALVLLPFVGTATEPPWATAPGWLPALLALAAILLRVLGAILVALAVLGFSGILRPKGPRP